MKKTIGLFSLILISNLYGQNDENIIHLSKSTITSERYTETPILENAGNVTVILSEEIEKRGYQNLTQILKEVPGLSFSGGNLSMRGQVPAMGNKNLMILVNGVPQNGIDNRSFDLDFIPIEDIKKIEVSPNGGGYFTVAMRLQEL